MLNNILVSVNRAGCSSSKIIIEGFGENCTDVINYIETILKMLGSEFVEETMEEISEFLMISDDLDFFWYENDLNLFSITKIEEVKL